MKAIGSHSPPDCVSEMEPPPLEREQPPQRSAKPSTPIPKSLSMTDSEDEDGFNSAFKVCIKQQ